MLLTDCEIRLKLEMAGLRATRQRIDLARVMFGSGDRHFTAETIHSEICETTRFPASLATVYNNLKQFAEAGLLQEIAVFGDITWFDTKLGDHAHFYFEDERRLEDAPEELLRGFEVPCPEGTRIKAVDLIVRVKRTV